ncbi:MFS transporter [Alkalilimnicola sp. S0819]|uniref:MFS transporter n=1 Tax=Alkalilimnicola sp. S0819 TaxID=2613922 RepID=UPI0012626C40|nr:MFS transporter [Alkalilimnicola sp. S0819]KAB7623897.1 MFS transporter [Alkalilimnicola sp. S0819]MPQ16492.1 MFS transporter [Alkalilimnicola sp. S0819]
MPVPAPRGALRLLLDPLFGRYFFGRLLSTTGIWIHNIVAAIVAWELSGSALMVGLVSVAQFAPQLLFAPLSGALADRGDRLRQLLWGRVIVTSGSGGLALWIALAGVDGLPGAWPVVAAAFIVGMGFVVGGPAMHALLPALVRRDELPSAVALGNIPMTLTRALGPALGALVALRLGPAAAFALAAGFSLLFGLLIAGLPVQSRARRKPGGDTSVWGGVRHLRVDPTVGRLLIGVAAVGIGADPAITLAPALSALHAEGTELAGFFASAFGVGAATVYLVLALLRRRLGLAALSTLGLGLLAAGMVALALSPGPWSVAASFVLAGGGMTCALTGLSTQVQQRLPDAVRGRVMALWSMAFLGSRPFASSTNGAVTDWFSVDAALGLVAFVLLLAAWLSRPSRMQALPDSVARELARH